MIILSTFLERRDRSKWKGVLLSHKFKKFLMINNVKIIENKRHERKYLLKNKLLDDTDEIS